MSLWAFVPDRTLVGIVPELPSSARRLDTGEWVTDVAKWAQACGYWDAEVPTVVADIQAAKDLTNAEVVALIAAFTGARDRAAARRGYVLAKRAEWNGAVSALQDWLDKLPPYEIPTNGNAPAPQPPTTLAQTIATVQWMYGRFDPRVTYLHEHEERLTSVIIPLGHFVFALAETLLEQIEASETFVPPIGWLVE